MLRWLPKYSLQWLQLDLMAGLTVGLTVVPQALAYAEVAGLPVQVSWSALISTLSLMSVHIVKALAMSLAAYGRGLQTFGHEGRIVYLVSRGQKLH